MFIHALQHRNDNPRHMVPELDRLLANDPPQDAAARAILNAGPAQGTVGVGELFRWVEWLFRP